MDSTHPGTETVKTKPGAVVFAIDMSRPREHQLTPDTMDLSVYAEAMESNILLASFKGAATDIHSHLDSLQLGLWGRWRAARVIRRLITYLVVEYYRTTRRLQQLEAERDAAERRAVAVAVQLEAERDAACRRADAVAQQLAAYEEEKETARRRRADELEEAQHQVALETLNARMRDLTAEPDPQTHVQRRGRPSLQAQHDADLATEQRNLEKEKINTLLQQERHQQRVNRALVKRRLAGARDPDSARQRKAEKEHEREKQRISEGLRSVTNDADRKAYARRELDAYVQRVVDENGDGSEEHDDAIAQAEEFMRTLTDREDA